MKSKKFNVSAIVFYSVIIALALGLPNMAFADTIQLPKTGQTKCYDTAGTQISCAGTGQDGERQMGVSWPSLRFHDNGNGTVTDNLTGLMWTQNANLPGSFTHWQNAMDYVAGMNNGTYQNFGYTDWHLPNVNELESLVNSDEPNLAIWLNNQGFANVQAYPYWSSTSYVYFSPYAWCVSMYYGYVLSADKSGYPCYVWPVRGGQSGSSDATYPANIWKTGQISSYYPGDDGALQTGVAWPNPRFTDNGNGTVTDNLTGLMWTQNANLPGSDMTWQQALDYVKTVNTGGYTDWRLPNKKELRSLFDYSRCGPALSQGQPFFNVSSYSYWSSTTVAYNPDNAWRGDSYVGTALYNVKSSSYGYCAWPVRGGTSVTVPRSLPDTGQTKCYDNNQEIACPQPGQDFYGQDAQYGPNLHSYTDLGDLVRDNVTGLEWQQDTAPGTYTWDQANTYCDNLTLGGHSDWRLPTIKELSILVDSSRLSPDPTIDTTYFPNTQESYYWSSTTYANSPTYAWYVYFNSNYLSPPVYYGPARTIYWDASYYVRAVR